MLSEPRAIFFQTEIVKGVLGGLSAVMEDLDCEVPPFLAQRCRVHCTAQPNQSEHSLDLLAGKVARVKESILPFGRPPSFFGVRFRFPPAVIVDGDTRHETSHEDFVTVRFETFSDDISQVWMEVAATYMLMEKRVALGSTETVQENIHASYKFLTENCRRFLDQFDVPAEETGPEATARE